MEEAFLLTFTCAGSWLGGQAQRDPPFRLNVRTGRRVVDAIVAVAGRRKWRVHAIHALPDRVSAVVEMGADPGRALRLFKTEASRGLAAEGLGRKQRWNRRGSWARLKNREAVRQAARRIVGGQGPPMVVFENLGRGARDSPSGSNIITSRLAEEVPAWAVGPGRNRNRR